MWHHVTQGTCLGMRVLLLLLACSRTCTGFGWDNDGNVLSVISDKSSVIFLWDANNRKLSELDSGFRFNALTYLLAVADRVSGKLS